MKKMPLRLFKFVYEILIKCMLNLFTFMNTKAQFSKSFCMVLIALSSIDYVITCNVFRSDMQQSLAVFVLRKYQSINNTDFHSQISENKLHQ